MGIKSKLVLRKRNQIQTVILFFYSFKKEEKLLFAIFLGFDLSIVDASR